MLILDFDIVPILKKNINIRVRLLEIKGLEPPQYHTSLIIITRYYIDVFDIKV